MNEELRERCQRFIERTLPARLGYTGDSIAERILRLYAAGKAPEGELVELLAIAIDESRTAAEKLGGSAGEYLKDSAALLEEIARQEPQV